MRRTPSRQGEWTMTNWRAKMAVLALSTALLSVAQVDKAFGLDVAGITVGVKPTLVTSVTDVIPGSVRTPAVFKLRIRVNTNGKNLRLCLGSPSDFSSGACPQPVAFSSRDGSGQLREGLGVVDTTQLFGKVLYIYNATSGAGPTDVVSFTLTVE